LLLGERLGRELPVLTIVAWAFVFASVAWVIVQPVWSFPTDLSGAAWTELLWIGIGGTALPFLAQFAAVRRIAAGIAGVVASMEPVVAAVAAWVWLDQVLTGAQMVGGLMVVGAVAVIQRWGVAEIEVPLEAAR
jgi:drug/metabolite transporter (DMT)-like permease